MCITSKPLDKAYPPYMPKLWKDTVAEHRRDVRGAICEAAWALASENGLRGVTMGEVAERAGIARATLYRYFHGVEEILIAAHAEHVAAHLAQLQTALSTAPSPGDGVRQLLRGYARICFHRGTGAPDLQGLVHAGEGHEQSRSQLTALFVDAVEAAQRVGDVRSDLGADELASYCVHALAAAGGCSSQATLDRLVNLIQDALRLATSPADEQATGMDQHSAGASQV